MVFQEWFFFGFSLVFFERFFFLGGLGTCDVNLRPAAKLYGRVSFIKVPMERKLVLFRRVEGAIGHCPGVGEQILWCRGVSEPVVPSVGQFLSWLEAVRGC